MAIFYDRFETQDEVEYRFRLLPLFYVALGIAAALSVASRGRRTNEFMGSFGLLLIAWIAGTLKPAMEIQRAMDRGSVEASGNKFSFSNPARVILRKRDTLKSAPETLAPSNAEFEL